MKNYKELQKICISEVIAAGIIPGHIVEWNINYRAKRRWGMCIKNNSGYVIQISSILLEDDRVSEKACKETIIHEILHTCRGCDKHTGMWSYYANIMNNKYGYSIKRATSGTEKGVEEYTPTRRLTYQYCYKCEKCGQIIRRKKACKFTRYYRSYTCGICGTDRAFHKN